MNFEIKKYVAPEAKDSLYQTAEKNLFTYKQQITQREIGRDTRV